MFTEDDYVKRTQQESILCMPIINQGRLIGILYLENKLARGAFTPERLELLKILSSQVATSVENAFLYNVLEHKVEERTQELKEVNERLLELDSSKTDFMSTVSHELRTPLTLILGFARIMGKKFENVILPNVNTEGSRTRRAITQMKENLNIIILEGTRLEDLINDFLDISKIEAGEVEWKMENISMEEVVKRIMITTSNLFDKNGLKQIIDIEEGLPEIRGDNDRLIQVVMNLVSNAVKFTEKGSVTCRIRRLNNEIVTSVIDTGTGIADDDIESVFEKFKQVGNRITGKPKGTGLGLPICKQIIEHYDGKIWVESEQGKGSIFSFTLPIPAIHKDVNLNN
jgi:signal transduction histidine kinase